MATIDEAQIVSALDELEALIYDFLVDYEADKPVSVIEKKVGAIEDKYEHIREMARARREYGTVWSSSKKLSVQCYSERDVDSTRALIALMESDELRPQALARFAKLVDMRIGAYYKNPIPGFDISPFLRPDKFKVRIDTPNSKVVSMRKAINWHLDAIGMAHLDDSVGLMEAMELMDALLRRDTEEYKAARKEAGL